VEQWFSPELGVVVQNTQRSGIGGEINYRLEQIVRAEPDAALFQVPPGYTLRKIPRVTYTSASSREPLPPTVRKKQ
jgi:hypothetical protein